MEFLAMRSEIMNEIIALVATIRVIFVEFSGTGMLQSTFFYAETPPIHHDALPNGNMTQITEVSIVYKKCMRSIQRPEQQTSWLLTGIVSAMKTGLLSTISFVGAALSSPLITEHISPALIIQQNTADPDACKGYTVKNVKPNKNGLAAHLTLADKCGIYGPDIPNLRLEVTHEDNDRLHVKIGDIGSKRYEVPEEVFPRSKSKVEASSANLVFKYTESPFSFSVVRKSTGEVLFDTKGSTLVFEEQYLRIKTILPNNANIYGLGEHTNTFRLDPSNTTRTLWNRDSGVAMGLIQYTMNIVQLGPCRLLLNSNGMDVKLSQGSLEYNIIGGILDFYFIGGNDGRTGPADISRGYAKLVRWSPASVPYWSLGFHQCRYGYKNFVDLANVVTNHSAAGFLWKLCGRILLIICTTMTKIYRHGRPRGGPSPNQGYKTFDRGIATGFMKEQNGSLHKGVVWPGVTVFPDWFHPNVSSYWTKEFEDFFSPTSGVDIDGVWIDMNEPSSFCNYPCNNPEEQAVGNPPPRTTGPPDIDTPIFQNPTRRLIYGRSSGVIDYNDPPAYGHQHANGLMEYDTHNMYGTMMAAKTREAMLARRPGLKPLIISRSTFAGAGAKTGKWLGDNDSLWENYRFSIAGMLAMAGLYQVPMVGSDVCGFGKNTTETLCARWSMLGAFQPFYRNHNSDTSISQEFYVWPSVTQAAKNAITMRYQLLDYLYTAIQQAHEDGSPVLNSLWFKYPQDANTYAIDLQFFYGDSILVSPVTEENSTSVDIYLPKDIFYDFLTYQPVQGNGTKVSLTNVNFTSIPVHIKGGSVLPLRASSAMTTKALREKDFNIVVAPGTDGKATGKLYLDDGVSLDPKASTHLEMSYSNKHLTVNGNAGYKTNSKVRDVIILGIDESPKMVYVNSERVSRTSWGYDSSAKTVKLMLDQALEKFTVRLD
ncbi:glycoside hydrolase family 31 protein [Rhizoctonia solani]|uniref:Probable alpha/beta-glucosidase agdC n=1 Tax=Rhizoctonia solani TaxID=456999 RepID=A0A8H8NY04_9AGAM|nr:glycoside hydrolase family 31 protein [Rhizoctonia solani]QRW20102.1 glycoside hydrolase family 31 protein [Rhizoctonia solani]